MNDKKQKHHSALPENTEKRTAGMRASHAINRYLHFLSETTQRGRPVDIGKLEADIATTDNYAQKAVLLAKLHREQAKQTDRPDGDELRNEFLKYINPYSERHGITYQVWRELGVPVADLKVSGFRR